METIIDKQGLLEHAKAGAEAHYLFIEDTVVKTRFGKIFPMPEQDMFAEELLKFLNKKVHLDGSWRIVWCKPKKSYYDKYSGLFRANVPTRLEMEFLDKDGDVQTSVYSDDPIWEMLDTGMTYYAHMCYDGAVAGREFIKTMELSKSQQYKRALGERPEGCETEVPL